MKAKELMTGDWVCLEDDPKPRQVDFIRTGEVGLYWNKIVTPPYIKPIPITPEILEKNGFKGDGYAILILDEQTYLDYYYYEHRLRKHWCGVDEWENHSKVNDITFKCNCYYVHELQHALRLCGIEKEIEL